MPHQYWQGAGKVNPFEANVIWRNLSGYSKTSRAAPLRLGVEVVERGGGAVKQIRKRKKRRPSNRAFLSRRAASADSSGVKVDRVKSRKARPSGPIIASPQSLQWTEGFDISKDQTVNWKRIDTRAIKFAMIKATEGVNYVDPSFEENWSAAGHLLALKRGAYHFFRPDDDVNEQIGLIRRTVLLKPTDLPIALDVENTQNRQLTPEDGPKLARILQSLVALFGRKPIIYTENDAWTNLGSPTSTAGVSFDDFPLWIAHYTSNPFPSYPAPWIQWLVWQFTDKGTVAGVTRLGGTNPALVDLDRFNGSPDGLIRFAALRG